LENNASLLETRKPLDSQELAKLIEAQIKNGRGTTGAVIRAAKIEKAEEVKEYWQSIAPEAGDRPTHNATFPTYDGKDKVVDLGPGDYKASIEVHAKGDRVRVGGTEPILIFAEYGTIHFPEGAYARRTTEHFNGEVSERTVNRRGQLTRPKPAGRVEA
jgi:hypothetical protein